MGVGLVNTTPLPRGGVFSGKTFDARGLLRGVPSNGGTRSADASGFPRETDEDVVQRRSTGGVVDAEEAEEEERTASAGGSQEEEDTAGPGEVAPGSNPSGPQRRRPGIPDSRKRQNSKCVRVWDLR